MKNVPSSVTLAEFGVPYDLNEELNTDDKILDEIAVANKIQLVAAHRLKVIV